jgi:uncharacterized protein (TIGR02145 family)
MNRVKTLLAAGLGLAMAFTLSCSDDKDEGGGGSSDSNGSYISSSNTGSDGSSSSVTISSCSGGSNDGDISSSSAYNDGSSSSGTSGSGNSSSGGSSLGGSCDIKDYKTVNIGDQTWMAENWNCSVPDDNSKCYDNDPANCDKYGRLYALRNGTICPSGWHLPTNAEWEKLLRFVDDTGGTSSSSSGLYSSPTAGKYLKATSGWNISNNGECSDEEYENCIVSGGEDKHDFAALPGGYFNGGLGSDNFIDISNIGCWWSASMSSPNCNPSIPVSCNYVGYFYLSMSYNSDGTNWKQPVTMGPISPPVLCSVRCVKD